jgi:DNA-binding transcriptional LysR family regulator
MKPRPLQRSHLEALAAVTRLQSVHAAARALAKTQPAVSRLVSEAESLLGVGLFDRSSRGMRPTPAGVAVIEQAQFILGSMQRLAESARLQRAAIALGCIPRAMHTLMAPLLERLHDEAAFDVKVTEGSSLELGEAIARGDLDFAITGREAPPFATDKRFAFEALYDEETVVICGRRNKAVPNRTIDFKALAALPWVLPVTQTASRATFDRFVHDLRLPAIAPVIEARSFESNLALVSGSRFLSIAPEPIARLHAALGNVRIVKLRRGLPASRIMLMNDRRAREDPVLEAFRRIVIATARACRKAGASRGAGHRRRRPS